MKIASVLSILLIFGCWSFGRSANILGYFPTPMISHQAFFQPLMKALSLKGHNVTVYRSILLNDTSENLKEIGITEYVSFVYGSRYKKWMGQSTSPFNGYYGVYETLAFPSIEKSMQWPSVKALIEDKTSTYDVVFVEPFPDFFLALGNKFNCPVIAIYSMSPLIPIHEYVGNPIHPVFYPDPPLSMTGDLDFFDRIYNTFQTLKIVVYHELSILRRFNELVKQYFGEHMPHFRDITRNISALFVNYNPVFDTVRPLTPITVPLSFMHIKPPQKLSTDVQRFLDSAVEGAIYVSLGSTIKAKFMPKEIIEIFRDVFNDLPFKVLWKLDDSTSENMSKNVYVKSWFNQVDVLGHKNIKLFITQGGIQSVQEGIFQKVPFLVLPLISDQKYNARRIQTLKIGKQINPFKLTKKIFKSEILEVIQNLTYKKEITRLYELSTDHYMTSIERAVWWTEYIIRHKGTKQLRNPYLDKPLYQYLMLDVIGFLLATTFAILYLIKKMNFFYKSITILLLSLLIGYLIV